LIPGQPENLFDHHFQYKKIDTEFNLKGDQEIGACGRYGAEKKRFFAETSGKQITWNTGA
jgi:hypothetical protein